MDSKEEKQPKKSRQRKKQLYKNILNMMEFYFSDSNLSKDRFLSELVLKDPYVDLQVFLKFNKILKLTEDLEDLQKSLNKSEILELSEDLTKVRRKTQVNFKKNVDDCTIYVERLNSDATHEWLNGLFSEFGKVNYVSIPKYKNKSVAKGFAFIEFESPQCVQNAVNFFEKIEAIIPSNMEPEKLCSVLTYEGDDKDEESKTQQDRKSLKRAFSPDNDEINKNEKKIKIENSQEKIDEVVENNEMTVKEDRKTLKRSHSHESNENNENANKLIKIEKDEKLDEGTKVNDEEVIPDIQKTKKKKNKNLISIEELGLQILTKKEWKKMRNTYLNMQRKKMKELKSYLSKYRSNKIKEQRNTAQETKVPEDTNNSEKEKLNMQFKPGLIVKVKLSETSQSSKTIKSELKSRFPEIQYVDVPYNDCEDIFLRFSDSEYSKQFCSSNFDGDSEILQGEEEKQYWDKILTDRDKKFSKNLKRQRGRDKLLKKAEKVMANHVRFDD